MNGLPGGLAAVLAAYTATLFAIAWWARGRIHDEADYVVAGRRLGTPLAATTLFATWFGAGTLLVAADEIAAEGIRGAALDPLGAGLCLLLAGLWLAGPLWRMQLLTLGDFFAVRFGSRAEVLASVLMVPGYFGWIAAQFAALAALLELTVGLEFGAGLVLVAVVGTAYTLIGGMWSVTATDALQTALLVGGLLLLAWEALAAVGDGAPGQGIARLAADTPASLLEPVPLDSWRAAVGWLGVLCVGALGNLPGQDLAQRIFASRSARVARRACFVAGSGYLALGVVPVLLGLCARLLAPDGDRAVLPLLAGLVLSPLAAIVFVVALASAVLSTIDSAILAPATVLARNVLGRSATFAAMPRLALHHLCVAVVGAASLGFALLGEDAYSMLETAYELGLVSLLVPLVVGVHHRSRDERAALAAMIGGTLVWLGHRLAGQDLLFGVWLGPLGVAVPVGLGTAALSALLYAGVAGLSPRSGIGSPAKR